MPRRLHIDFETYSQADLKSVGAYRYAFDSSTEILCAAMALDDEKPVVWRQGMDWADEESLCDYWDALQNPDVLVIAHNAAFEMAICQALLQKTWGIPCPDLSRFRCTASLARRASLPAKLEMLAVALNLSQLKDNRGKALIKKFSIMQPAKRVTKKNPAGLPPCRIRPEDDPAAFAEFMAYCAQDVVVEQEVARKLAYFDEPINNANYSLDAVINARGVTVNLDALRHAQTLIEEETALVGERFRKLTGIEHTQGAKFLEWLHAQGVHLDNLQAETIETFLRGVTEDGEKEASVLALRMKQSVAYASIKKVATMITCAGPHDNRIRGMLTHHGASTGRWTNVLVQFQNMKRSTIKDSDVAYAEICSGVSREMLELCHGSVLEVISSCVRHFVHDAKPCFSCKGHGVIDVYYGDDSCHDCNGTGYQANQLLDADYAAIEARIVNWLAGQEDALQEYRDGVDRYKRMASVIYGIPADEVNKFPQRFVGKQAVLLCGFQGGAAKFRSTCMVMGGYDLPEGLETKAVNAFRKQHHHVVRYWYAVEEAAKQAILHRGEVFRPIPKPRRGESGVVMPKFADVRFQCRDVEGMPFLLLRLPSGRKLAYPKPRLVPSKHYEGATSIVFHGNIKGVQWGDVDTYGGKLVENCLSGATLVLSQQRGWIELKSLSLQDNLWDGVEFVQHQGLLDKGMQKVLHLYGVTCTPEHLFLSGKTWISAEYACTHPECELSSVCETPFLLAPRSAPQFVRTEVRQSFCNTKRPRRWQEDYVDMFMRLWQGVCQNRYGVKAQNPQRMWFSMPCYTSSYRGRQLHSQNEQASSVCSSFQHAGPLQQSTASSMGQLWRAWNLCVRTVARFFRGLLGGYGANVSARVGHRSGEQQWGLHSRELSVGNTADEYPQHTKNTSDRRSTQGFLGCGIESRNQADNSVLQAKRWSNMGTSYQHPSGHTEQVFDIKNCGPHNCFVVRGTTGPILIAHNCTQAVAADIMAHGAHNAEKAGYQIATLIHDQALAYHQPGQTAEEFVRLLTDLPPWAAGLPIEAEGGLVDFYRKD